MKALKKTCALAIVLYILTPVKIFAWGADGHKIVAEIAKSYLNKETAILVQQEINPLSFEEESVWMDEIKKDHSFDYMKPWHYVNVEKDKTYVAGENGESNIISVLQKTIAALGEDLKQKGTDAEKARNMDFKLLFHLIGDLHMPLHVGYGADKGGNDSKVDFLGKQTNLHHVWDSDIIQQTKITAEECMKAGAHFTPKEIRELQKINVLKWMDESRSLLAQVYDFSDGKITEEYINKNKPVIEKQLFLAGIRLAAVLNQYVKK